MRWAALVMRISSVYLGAGAVHVCADNIASAHYDGADDDANDDDNAVSRSVGPCMRHTFAHSLDACGKMYVRSQLERRRRPCLVVSYHSVPRRDVHLKIYLHVYSECVQL